MEATHRNNSRPTRAGLAGIDDVNGRLEDREFESHQVGSGARYTARGMKGMRSRAVAESQETNL